MTDGTGSLPRIQEVYFLCDDVVLDEQLPVLFIRAVLGERPAWLDRVLVEGAQQWLLFVV